MSKGNLLIVHGEESELFVSVADPEYCALCAGFE